MENESNQILHNFLENTNEIFLLTADQTKQYQTSFDCRYANHFLK